MTSRLAGIPFKPYENSAIRWISFIHSTSDWVIVAVNKQLNETTTSANHIKWRLSIIFHRVSTRPATKLMLISYGRPTQDTQTDGHIQHFTKRKIQRSLLLWTRFVAVRCLHRHKVIVEGVIPSFKAFMSVKSRKHAILTSLCVPLFFSFFFVENFGTILHPKEARLTGDR